MSTDPRESSRVLRAPPRLSAVFAVGEVAKDKVTSFVVPMLAVVAPPIIMLIVIIIRTTLVATGQDKGWIEDIGGNGTRMSHVDCARHSGFPIFAVASNWMRSKLGRTACHLAKHTTVGSSWPM
jgi:hypothetical protein